MDGRIAVLASGEGTNLQALIDDEFCGPRIALVLSDRGQARALDRARDAGLTAVHLDPAAYAARAAYDAALVGELKQADITYVALAGFMRILGPQVVEAYRGRMLNVHPSLLPAFPGGTAVKDALDWGAKVTGVTVHLVDEELDNGPIVLQGSVPILSGDDWDALETRVHGLEHQLFPLAVRAMVEGRIRVDGRRATIEE